MNRRRFFKVMGVTAAGLVLAGCAAEEPEYTIEMVHPYHFLPASLVIPKGATVVWLNKGSTLHTATCDPDLAGEAAHVQLAEGADAWHSGDLYPGRTWKHTFNTPGSYIYFCRYHVDDNMIGAITVEESS